LINFLAEQEKLMAKPSYEELEKKINELENQISQVTLLEGQILFLENQFLQVEKQLQQRQRMDSLGMLAQGVAHDFNNILSGIMAYLNILTLTSDNFSSAQKNYVQNIINSVKRGAATIKQFQKLSSKSVSVKENIDIFTVAEEVFQLFEETSDKMIEKKLDIEKGQIFICADSNEIHQVLMNLFTNAVHAIEGKGVKKGDYIRLSVKLNSVDESAPKNNDNFYQVCFEDTGSGMSKEVRKKAFDPLFTTKQDLENKGQGLGLAMVNDIVTKRHGGHINLVSTLGQGTIFNLFLPKADDECSMPESQLSIQGGTETILLVDDDTAVRESMKTALEDFGYNVITACDGEEGLNLFKANNSRIDAVLLDMVMPKMSGKELLTQMLKIDPGVKVIISSGHSEDQYHDTIIKSAKNYLNKPFEIDELENTLRQVLDL